MQNFGKQGKLSGGVCGDDHGTPGVVCKHHSVSFHKRKALAGVFGRFASLNGPAAILH
jgi:hypothetical protein